MKGKKLVCVGVAGKGREEWQCKYKVFLFISLARHTQLNAKKSDIRNIIIKKY